jgi:hypothetical protein
MLWYGKFTQTVTKDLAMHKFLVTTGRHFSTRVPIKCLVDYFSQSCIRFGNLFLVLIGKDLECISVLLRGYP